MFRNIILIMSIIVVSSLSYYKITIDDGTYTEDDWASTTYNASKYVEGTKVSTQGIETETTAKEHWDTIIEEEGEVEEYLVSETELEKLMNAEIRSQFPKIENAQTELNGIVEFQRHKEGGEIVKLEFVDFDTFQELRSNNSPDIQDVFTLDTNNNLLIGIVTQTTEILTYNDSDIQVSEYSENLTQDNLIEDGKYQKITYQVSSRTIDYREIIKKYSLPFQYLWSLVVVTEDKDFALELVDLIDDSQIIVSIYDNMTTTNTLTTYEYEKQYKVDVDARVTVSASNGYNRTETEQWYPAAEWSDGKYEVKKLVQQKQNAPLIDVYKADVWFIDYSKNYVEQDVPTQSYEDNTINFTDPVQYTLMSEQISDQIKDEGYQKYSYKLGDFSENVVRQFQSELPNSIVVDNADENVDENAGENPDQSSDENADENAGENPAQSSNENADENAGENPDQGSDENAGENVNEPVKPIIQSVDVDWDEYYYEGKKKISQTEQKEEIKKQYVSNDSTKVEKVKKKDEQIKESGTWEPNFVTIICEDRHVGARKKLDENDVDDWLFELLETNPDTKDMVDLTKYLLYKLVGKDKYGIKNYDFSVFESDGFYNVGGAITGGSIQEKVWFALKALNYTDEVVAGAMGNIDLESGGFSPTAVEDGGTGIGLIQWSHGRADLLRKYADSKQVSWQDVDTQIEFLISEITGQGVAIPPANKRVAGYIGDEGITSTVVDWENSKTVEEATLHFMRFFASPSKKETYDQNGTWGESRVARALKYYNEFAGREAPVIIHTQLTGENKEKMQKMITEAIRIANDDSYQYSQPKRESMYYYDCSSLVSRLYKQYFNISRLDYGPPPNRRNR